MDCLRRFVHSPIFLGLRRRENAHLDELCEVFSEYSCCYRVQRCHGELYWARNNEGITFIFGNASARMCGQKAAKIRPLRQKIRRLHNSTARYHAGAQKCHFAFRFRCGPPNPQVDVSRAKPMRSPSWPGALHCRLAHFSHRSPWYESTAVFSILTPMGKSDFQLFFDTRTRAGPSCDSARAGKSARRDRGRHPP